MKGQVALKKVSGSGLLFDPARPVQEEDRAW
jgi:hypothetical protein